MYAPKYSRTQSSHAYLHAPASLQSKNHDSTVVKTNLEKKLVAVVGLLIQIVNKIVSQS